MRWMAAVLASLMVIAVVLAGCGASEQPTTTPAPTSTPGPTATAPPTAAPTTMPTASPPAPTQTPAGTPSPTPTATGIPTVTPYPGSLNVGPYRSILLVNLDTPYYANAIKTLEARGYTVDSRHGATPFDEEVLEEYGIVVLEGGYLTGDKIPLLNEWVRSGGSALFLAEPGLSSLTQFNGILSPLYGVAVNDDQVKDPDHLFVYATQNGITTTAILEHPITNGVSELQFFTEDGLPSLTVTDDETATLVEGEIEAFSAIYGQSPPLAAAGEHAGGRVVVVCGSNDKNSRTFGDRCLSLADNGLFLSNIVDWLAHKLQ